MPFGTSYCSFYGEHASVKAAFQLLCFLKREHGLPYLFRVMRPTLSHPIVAYPQNQYLFIASQVLKGRSWPARALKMELAGI